MTQPDRNQTGRIALRVLLATFVIVSLATLLIPNTLKGDRASAQSSPSPTPTGPTIQFLNPSGTTANSTTSGPGREVSVAEDGSGFGYHLVAWVAHMPQNATVEFKYQGTGSSDVEQPIGQGTLRGTDTFDIFWNLGTLGDANYQVKAIMFSNGVEVSRDTESVVVNNADAPRQGQGPAQVPTGEDRGETVEITYPTQAGLFGAFRKPGTNDPYAGVVDVTSSEGTNNVRAYYTTSHPGTEPSWTRCSSPAAGEARTASLNGVRCTLAGGVHPSSVTAIAAAAGDANQSADAGTCVPPTPPSTTSPCGEGEDSGDAHRATGYAQVPSSVAISPATQDVGDADPAVADNQFPCSNVITGTVLDQFQRKVAGANADVHASGPVDTLYFDDPDATGSYVAPNSNNHAIENSANCEDTAFPRAFNSTAGQGQGEHEVLGEGDLKHVEATATGTDDAGQIPFRLYNRSTTAGVTQFTVYYDRNDDDQLCSEEPSGDGSIGWGTSAGTPSGVADENTVCPEPSPTPTGSPSPSGTVTPTRGPTATVSGSPTPTRSPGTSRTVTIAVSDQEVEHGTDITISGRIFSNDSSCIDNEFVRIRRRVHGSDAFEALTSANTGTQGDYEVLVPAKQSADYQAVAPAHDNCAEALSNSETVLVKVEVSITTDKVRPQRGDRLKFLGKVTPDHVATKVVLERRKGGRWVRVESDVLNSRSRYRIVIDVDWRRGRVFRVKWDGAQDADHETGSSRRLRIESRR